MTWRKRRQKQAIGESLRTNKRNRDEVHEEAEERWGMINRWLIGYCLFEQYKSLSAIWLFHLLPSSLPSQTAKVAESLKKSIEVNTSPFPCRHFGISVPFRLCVIRSNKIKLKITSWNVFLNFAWAFFSFELGECLAGSFFCAAKCPSNCINLHKIDCT